MIKLSQSARKTGPINIFLVELKSVLQTNDFYYYLINIICCKSNLLQEPFNRFYTFTKKRRTDKFKSGPRRKAKKENSRNVISSIRDKYLKWKNTHF